MQPINALGQRLAFHAYGIGEFDRGVFIRAGTPDLAVGHKAAPDFPPFYQRAMVIDGDVGNADTLNDFCVLAVTRQIQQGGLRVAAGGGENNCDEHGCKREVPSHRNASWG